MVTKFHDYIRESAQNIDEKILKLQAMVSDKTISPQNIIKYISDSSSLKSYAHNLAKLAISEDRIDVIQHIYNIKLDFFTHPDELIILAGDDEKYDMMDIIRKDVKINWKNVLNNACTSDKHLSTFNWIVKNIDIELYPLLYYYSTGSDDDFIKTAPLITKRLYDLNCLFDNNTLNHIYNDNSNEIETFEFLAKTLDDAISKDEFKIFLLKKVDLYVIKEYFTAWFVEKYDELLNFNFYTKAL